MLRQPKAAERVLRVLDRNPTEALTRDAIAQRAGCSSRTARNCLLELKRAGKVHKRRDFSRSGGVFVWGRVAV